MDLSSTVPKGIHSMLTFLGWPILWSRIGKQPLRRWPSPLGINSLVPIFFPFYAKMPISLPFRKQGSYHRFLEDTHFIPISFPFSFLVSTCIASS